MSCGDPNLVLITIISSEMGPNLFPRNHLWMWEGVVLLFPYYSPIERE